MIEKLIYKHTSFAVAGLIAVGAIVGFIALSNTAGLLFRYFDLKSTLESLPDVPQVATRDHTNPVFEEVDLNAVLFKAVTEAARTHSIQVKNINTPMVSSNPDFQVLTEEVTLEGGFVNTVRCLEEATRELKQVKLSSLKFERDQTPRSNALYTTAYFQTIRKNEDEAKK